MKRIAFSLAITLAFAAPGFAQQTVKIANVVELSGTGTTAASIAGTASIAAIPSVAAASTAPTAAASSGPAARTSARAAASVGCGRPV